jgi:hypothetical protein
MGLPSMTPAIGILDDCDRPEAAMLVIVFGHPARPTVEYINPEKRPLALRGRLSNFPNLFTPLTAFGMTALFEEDGALQVRPHGESTAAYPDGAPRRWQGRPIDAICVRFGVAGHVMKAVQAMRAARIAEAVERRKRAPTEAA